MEQDLKLFYKLELLGSSLILLSFAWQFFIVESTASIPAEWQREHIEKRLDEIHARQFQLQKNQNALAQSIANGETRPISLFVDEIKYSTPHKKGSPILRERADGYRYLGVILFVLGSFILIVGKFIEFSSKNA